MRYKLQSIFRRFDADSDGRISTAELEAVIIGLTGDVGLSNEDGNKIPAKEDAAFVMAALDVDQSGTIEEDEVCRPSTDHLPPALHRATPCPPLCPVRNAAISEPTSAPSVRTPPAHRPHTARTPPVHRPHTACDFSSSIGYCVA